MFQEVLILLIVQFWLYENSYYISDDLRSNARGLRERESTSVVGILITG